MYVTSTPIATTTGAKSIFAGINLPQSVVNSLKGQPMSKLYSTAMTLTHDQMTGTENGTLKNGLMMFSDKGVDATFVADKDGSKNKVTITCKRMVAKVTVATNANYVKDETLGKISDFKFAVNNFNTKSFMLQGAYPDFKDPNWEAGSWKDADFTQAAATDYVDILDHAVTANPTPNQYNVHYAAENTSEGNLQKEITRATVRGKFIPKAVTKYANGTNATGGFTTVEDYGNVTVPTTFWSVSTGINGEIFYFTSEAVANAFMTEKGGTKTTWENGYCYWTIFLGKSNPEPNKWDVLRNDYYRCTISKIVGPGRPTPEVPGPETKPEEDTKITATVDILWWVVKDADYELY
jgi:hypothetical protein